jgi:hypothetical protein
MDRRRFRALNARTARRVDEAWTQAPGPRLRGDGGRLAEAVTDSGKPR